MNAGDSGLKSGSVVALWTCSFMDVPRCIVGFPNQTGSRSISP
jgi:hypothetical protein